MDEFVHLHNHGHHSLLDGAGTPEGYAKRAAELGQPALALTDHGSLSMAMEFWKQCNAAGVKPIIGCEFYVAPQDRFHKQKVKWGSVDDAIRAGGDVSGQGAYTHLTVAAKSPEGVRNLYRLQYRAYSEGFYRKPRIDTQLLAEHHEGLVVTSGCAGSAISTRLRLGQVDAADELAYDLSSIFGDDFYIEIMSHDIGAWEVELNHALIELATRHSIPLVATNDSHYVTQKDDKVHDALLCLQTGSKIADEKRFRFNGSGYYLRSRAEMESLGLPTESLSNTLVVAEKVESYDSVFEKKVRFPKYAVPDGWTSEEALESLAEQGLEERQGQTPPDEYLTRLYYELEVICSLGFADYFLVLGSILTEAKRRGIRIGPGRGSAGGSLVAYALGITDLDPIVHRLVFERFLNPERVSLPDIDVDIDESRRDEVFAIAREMYGEEYVAHIGTFGTIGAKAALKDANRVLGWGYSVGEARTKMLPPPKFGRAPGLNEYSGPKDEIYDLAVGLEGKIRNEGIHAAGLVISPEPLASILPVRKPKGTEPEVAGFVMGEVEALGLVKYDFLALRNLGIIDECLRMVPERVLRSGLPYLPDECNDRATYELLSRGDTLGVFQLDGSGMRGLLRLLRPDRFDDISAVLALFRPGPMGANAHTEFAHRKNKHAGSWSSEWAIHPDLEEALRPVLEETYGLIVFQEQVLDALKVVCGWSYAEAGLLFDAMRKKNHEKMDATKPDYYRAGKEQGFSAESLDALWETLVPFADYSFNRAHSAGYGLVAYWTAYLKANHPAEYMAAVLSSVAEDDRLPDYLAECGRIGLAVLPPDINLSGVGFSPGNEAVHYGIGAIKGVGEAAFGALSKGRPYRSLDDFFRRADPKVLNTGVLGALIRSGTLDSLSPLREELYVARENLATRALAHRAELRAGQRPLYRVAFGVGASGLHDLSTRQQWEQETLSTVLSHGAVTLRAARPVSREELIWLKEMFQTHPGKTEVTAQFGVVGVPLGTVDWAAVEANVNLLGAFEC